MRRHVTLVVVAAIASGCGAVTPEEAADPAPQAEGYFADRCGYTNADQDNSSSTFYAVAGAKLTPFRATAKLTMTSDNLCSSVLIAPDELLTSAHCFEGGAQVRRASFHDSVTGLPVVADVASVRLHPDYEAALARGETLATSAGLASVDVAYVKLKAPLTDRAPVPMTSVGTELTRGKLLALVGYGDVGRGAGTKRFAQSHVGRIVAGESYGGQNFHDLLLLDSRSGTGACLGDSGGGVFVKEGETYALIGVVNGVNDVLYPGFPISTCDICPRGIGIVTLVSNGR